jgi:hypothetical protein
VIVLRTISLKRANVVLRPNGRRRSSARFGARSWPGWMFHADCCRKNMTLLPLSSPSRETRIVSRRGFNKTTSIKVDSQSDLVKSYQRLLPVFLNNLFYHTVCRCTVIVDQYDNFFTCVRSFVHDCIPLQHVCLCTAMSCIIFLLLQRNFS